jgi:hypothetical protein
MHLTILVLFQNEGMFTIAPYTDPTYAQRK